VNGSLSASGQFVSTAATGTGPLQVASTTQVAHLNASLLGGLAATSFQPAGSYATLGGNTFSGNQSVTGTGRHRRGHLRDGLHLRRADAAGNGGGHLLRGPGFAFVELDGFVI